MQHIEGSFAGVRGARLYYQAWLPTGNVKAVLLLVHGLGEHSGRYMNYVNQFAPQGYAIYGMDHLGHGKSDGEREMVERFADYTDSLAIYHQMVAQWQPNEPMFILGHSMGGLIACTYLLDRQADFAGAIISAPAIKVSDSISPLTVIMGRVLARIAPKAGVLALDVNGVSRDPEVVSAYVNDPLIFHGKVPARLAAEMLKAMTRVTDGVETIRLPFIALQGSADRLVDPGGARMLYERAASKDKTLKVYEGLYHEVHHEPERAAVFNDVATWLAAHGA